MTAEAEHGDDARPAERGANESQEFLYRQVHPQWIVEGEPSSQAFRPTKKDEGMLSIALGSKTTAEDAFLHHTQVLKLASGGTWAVTVGEVAAVELSSYGSLSKIAQLTASSTSAASAAKLWNPRPGSCSRTRGTEAACTDRPVDPEHAQYRDMSARERDAIAAQEASHRV